MTRAHGLRALGAAFALLASSAAGAVGYEWHLPAGFPTPRVPLDNPMSVAKVELGRRLFFDERLSITGKYACASCHRPELAYADGLARAQGATGNTLRRAAPSLANVAYLPAYTWADPGIASLEAQMRRPLFNAHPVELGFGGDPKRALAALSADATYPQMFAQAFADERSPANAAPANAASVHIPSTPITLGRIIKAIAAFERTLISGRSPFDRYVFGDEREALSPAAKRGMALFYSKAVGCGACHFGLNFSGPLRYQGHPHATAIYANTGFYDVTDTGLIEVTRRRNDLGRFRIPTLRNIALTAPYMHDGSVATLDAVLDHYAANASDNGHRSATLTDRRLQPFTLTAVMKQDLLEFLRSLTDQEFAQDHRLSR